MVFRKIKLSIVLVGLLACIQKKAKVAHPGGYPADVASVIYQNCAVAGCHNELSKEAAAGLSLSSWESMFKGGRNGPVVIPFRPDFSTFCFYTNTFSDLGPTLLPTMPPGRNPLNREDYQIIRNWIEHGAPNSGGFVKFSDSDFRSKFYITNQLCDLVSVVDAGSKLIMRCIDVGVVSKNEFPVCIRVSPDSRYWFLSFLASTIFQKYDAVTDRLIGQLDLGPGIWSTFDITGDSKYAFCIDNSASGKLTMVDLSEMRVVSVLNSAELHYPRSPAIFEQEAKLYLGAESGNYLSVVNYAGGFDEKIRKIILDGSNVVDQHSVNDPVALQLNEQTAMCYVACRNSNEIKVVSLLSDTVMNTISLNAQPSFLTKIPGKNLLLVTCTNDSLSFPGKLGSVQIIDLDQNRILKILHTGFQPTEVSVDPSNNCIAIVSSNTSPKGPRPHHTGACSGRNGYLNFIDLKTLEVIPSLNYELAVYPYSIAFRK